jgi:hypothetical protein
MFNGILADSPVVRLVNHDGMVVVLGENVPAGFWPDFSLF